MSPLLVFHFDGISAPLWMARHEADVDWWRLLAKRMGMGGFVMVDQTEDQKGRHYKHADESIGYAYCTKLAQAEAAFSEHDWFYFDQAAVAVEGGQVTQAEDFDFLPTADSAVYVFGSDLHGIDLDDKPRHIVSFQTLPIDYVPNAAVLAMGLRYLQVEGL